MKHMINATIIGMLIIYPLVCHASSTSEPVSQAALVLKINTTKQQYVLYEPIVVSYTLSNPTDSVIVSKLFDLAYCYRQMNLWIKHEAGAPVPFTSSVTGCHHTHERLTTHDPGQVMINFLTILDNYFEPGTAGDPRTGGFGSVAAFPDLGDYTITGSISLGNFESSAGSQIESVRVEAQPITIELKKPSALDKKVIEFVGGEEILSMLLRGRIQSYCGDQGGPSCLEDLRLLVNRFSRSAYAPHISYIVAMVLSSGGFLGVEQGPSLGADLYIDALRRWPDHGRKYTILSNLPYILELNGRMEEAKAWADRYGREYPGNRNIRRAMQKDMNRAPQRRRN